MFPHPKSLLNQLIVAKYGRGDLEGVTNMHSNGNWRWKDILFVSQIETQYKKKKDIFSNDFNR